MESFRKVVLVLLVVTAISAATVSPAGATPAAPERVRLACNSGICQIAGDVPGALGLLRAGANLALMQAPFVTREDGGSHAELDLKKDITLSLPVGDVTLSNARLQVEVDEDGRISRLNGSADMPFPTFGLLDDARVVTPARSSIGLDLGKNLPETPFELAPERPYLFFNADSGMRVSGRTPGSTDDFSLSFTPGQRATLIIDTVEPVAYLDGRVTLSGIDQIALLGGLLESTPVAEYVPDTLPLRERTQFGLSGKFSKDVTDSRLTLSGAYILDAGLVPAQLGVDAHLVNVLGELSVSREGVLVNGVLKSAIEPDKLFDGSVQVYTFIAFSEPASASYAGVDASVKIPAARLGVGAGAKAGRGEYELSGQLATPLADEWSGKVRGQLPDVAGAVRPVFSGAAGAAGSAADAVGLAAQGAAGAIGASAGRAGVALAGYARTGFDLVGDFFNAGKSKLLGDSSQARSGL